MSLHTRVASAIALNHLSRIGDFVLLYLTTVLIARSLGAEAYGGYAVFLSVTQVLILVSSLGLETSIVSSLPSFLSQKKEESRTEVVVGLLAYRVIGIAVVVVLLLAFRSFLASAFGLPPTVADDFLLLLVFFSSRNLVAFFSAVYISDLDVKKLAIISLVTRVVEIAGVISLIALGKGLSSILVFITSTAVLQSLALAVGAQLRLFTWDIQLKTVWPTVGLGARFWMGGMMEFLLGRQADVLLLGVFLVGQTSIGQYDVALGLAQGINVGMTAGFAGAGIASFAAMMNGDKSQLRDYLEFTSRLTVMLVVPILALAIVLADIIIPRLYTPEFNPSIVLFQIFGAALIVTRFLSGGVASNFLSALGKADKLLQASLLSGGVNLVLALAIIPSQGVLGAVTATSAGSLLIAGLHAYFTRREIRVIFPWKFGLGILTLSVLSALVARIVYGLLQGWEAVGGLLLSFAFTFIALLWLAKPLTLKDNELLMLVDTRIEKLLRPFVRHGGSRDTVSDRGHLLTDRQKWAYKFLPTSGILLDLGSSRGPLCGVLKEKANLVVAVDIDLGALESIPEEPGRPDRVQCSALNLPIRSASVDTVLLLDVLEHVGDETRTFDEIDRVLRPGGSLILSVPHKGLFAFLDPQNIRARLDGHRSPTQFHPHYSMRDLDRLVANRFRIMQSRYGALFLYPISFAASNFFRKHFGRGWEGLFRKMGDVDYGVSWGRLSYNLIVHFVKQ